MLPPARSLSLAGAVAVATLAASCLMSSEEGAQMERDLRAVEEEFAEFKLEQQRREAERVARIKRMSESLEQSDEQARKADADFFVRIDQLIQEIEHRLAQLEAAKAAVSPPPTETAEAPADDGSATPAEPAAPALPEDKQALYDLAKQAHDDGKYDDARRAFRQFHKRFPADSVLSDNSLYWIGEGHYKESTYDKAILTFQEVINKYPKSDKLDAALYKIGRSFEALGLREDAVLFYEDLVSKYPKSKLVRDAKKRIRSAKKSKKKSRRRRSAG